MKSILVPKTILLAALSALLVPPGLGAAENMTDALELVRSSYRTDRQALVAETLQLSESESSVFWPIYKSYRADMDKLGDGLVKLVLEYADVYPDVPDDRAQQLLKDYTALEEKLASKRSWYFKRVGKALSAAKALRWAQLENRMDLILRLQLAGAVPLMPAARSQP